MGRPAETTCQTVTAQGACAGTRHCKTDGVVSECDAPDPVPELCDGQDNDCNGSVDDNLSVPATSKTQGVCAGLKKLCKGKSGGKDPDFSKIAGYETSETLCDGKDNNCDGTIDNLPAEVTCAINAFADAGSKTNCASDAD